MELLSGTNELKKVLKEVERRKEEAVNAGLDRLFLDAYHRSIRHYQVWIKNQTQRRYVHPDVSNPTARIIRNPAGDTFITEFMIGDKKYRVESQRRNIYFAYDNYYTMELFLNDKKMFALHEKHGAKIQGTRYYTLDIEAYLGNEWVSDFKMIKEYQDAIETELAEEVSAQVDAELVSKLRMNFNIGSSDEFYPVRIPRYILPQLLTIITILVFVLFFTLFAQ